MLNNFNIPSWLSSEFLEDSEDANGAMDISDIGSSIGYNAKVPKVHLCLWSQMICSYKNPELFGPLVQGISILNFSSVGFLKWGLSPPRDVPDSEWFWV